MAERRMPVDIRRLLFNGSFWLLVFQSSSKLTTLATTLLAAHELTVAEFGVFAAIQGVTIVAAAVLDFGTSAYVEREVAAHRGTAQLVHGAVMVRALVVAPAAALALLAGAALSASNETTMLSALFICAGLAINASSLTNGLLLGQLRFRGSAMTQVAGRLVFLTAMLLLWASSQTTVVLATFAFMIGEVATLGGQVALLRSRPPTLVQGDYGHHLLGALPYWLNSVFSLTYNRADSAIVAILAGPTAAGLYAPASAIQSALITVTGLPTAGVPNVGARVFAERGRDMVASVARRTGLVAIATGLVTATIATVTADAIIQSLLGPDFAGSVAPTQVLAWSLPFYGAEFALVGYLIAIGRPALTVWGYATALTVSLIGNLLLTPTHGALGGAIASLAREPAAVLALALAIWWSESKTGRRRHDASASTDRRGSQA